MKVEKIKREDIKMANNQKNNNGAKIMALVLAGLMVFSAVAGALAILLG